MAISLLCPPLMSVTVVMVVHDAVGTSGGSGVGSVFACVDGFCRIPLFLRWQRGIKKLVVSIFIRSTYTIVVQNHCLIYEITRCSFQRTDGFGLSSLTLASSIRDVVNRTGVKITTKGYKWEKLSSLANFWIV